MPTETLSRTASSPAPTEQVWQALQAPDTWEGIPGIDEVIVPHYDEDGQLAGFDFTTRVGGRSYRGRASRAPGVDGQSMGWKVETPELVGSVMVALQGNADGTDLTVTLTFASVGMMSSMFFPVISGSIGSEFPDAVDRFAREISRN